MIRVAINGYGRIGRNILRAYYERPQLRDSICFVAINDLSSPELNAHLTQYDTTHGQFSRVVLLEDSALSIGQDKIPIFAERDPSKLPWKNYEVDVVFECSGKFTDKKSARMHLDAGANKVLISAPVKGADATVVYGINHRALRETDQIISNASCTTNSLAHLVAPIHRAIGIEQGLMTTIHSYTNDQNLSDVHHTDPYRARAAGQNMIPTKTGAASTIGLILPELKGRLDGLAVRVPTLNVSLVDLTLSLTSNTTVDTVNSIMKDSSDSDPFGVLSYTELPLVSSDFNHNSFSSNFDANHTRAQGNLIKVLAWYDNEWGFSNRMLDTALAMVSTEF